MSGAEQALHSLRLELLELPPTHRVLKAMERLEQYMEKVSDLEKGLGEWRSMALDAQAQVKHQAGQRESELVTLLKDILHCSDVFATFRPDLHARLLDFGRQLKAQEPKDDFPEDYEVN
jgi:hypothetical protein